MHGVLGWVQEVVQDKVQDVVQDTVSFWESTPMTQKKQTPNIATFPMRLTLLLLFASTSLANDGMRLTCEPQSFHVIPGEPMRLQLTVQSDAATSFRLHVPAEPLLKLRTIEKLPVQRTGEGTVIYQRVVLWQGLEPGTVRIKTLSVETQEQTLFFPEVSITIRDPGP